MGLASVVTAGPQSLEVLLPCFNGATFLEAQVLSIYSQSLRPSRLLLRDDGSRDATPALVARLEQRFPGWLVPLPSGLRLGCRDNVALLLESSRADYVALADQDDLWDSHRLATCLDLMRRLEIEHGATTPLLVHSDLRLIDRGDRFIAPSFHRLQRLDPRRTGLDDLSLTNVVTGCTVLLNRACVEAALPIPEAAVLHDWWLALVASRCGAIGYVDVPTVAYRQHGANLVGAVGSGPARLFRLLYPRAGEPSGSYRLARALGQIQSLDERFPGAEPALLTYAQSSCVDRLSLLLSGRLRKHGPLRTLGLYVYLLALPCCHT